MSCGIEDNFKRKEKRKKKSQIYLNDFSRFSFAQSFERFFQIFKEKRETEI